MNHAWIALLVPMFLSPRAECDKHKNKDKDACCQATRTVCCQQSKSSCCQQKDAKHDEDADADDSRNDDRDADLLRERAENDAELAQERAEEQAERASREADEQVERAEREVERAEREAEEQAERADRDSENLQMDLRGGDDDSDAEGDGDSQSYARVLDLSKLDQESAEKVRAAVQRAMEQAKSAMKKVKSSCLTLDQETKKQLAEALKAAELSSGQMQKALRVNREALSKALTERGAYTMNGWPLTASLENNGLWKVHANGSNDQRALEERVAALEAKLGIHRDDANGSLEDRVAELERRMGTPNARVAPRSGARRAPRAAIVVPATPSMPVTPPPPAGATAPVPPAPAVPPAPQQGDAPELWMRSPTPRPPSALAIPPPAPPQADGASHGQSHARGRSRSVSDDQRREIQERMQKMREEMEKLREEMSRLRDELSSQSR